MYIIYALISRQKKWIYVGLTADLKSRLHIQSGYEHTSAPYRPFDCIELAIAFTRIDARRLEKWYKTSYGKQVIRMILKNNDSYPL